MIFNFLKKMTTSSASSPAPIEKLTLKTMEEELKNFNFEKPFKSKKI